jgi:hypothetical protein
MPVWFFSTKSFTFSSATLVVKSDLRNPESVSLAEEQESSVATESESRNGLIIFIK